MELKAIEILEQIISDYPTPYILNRKKQIKKAIAELESLEIRKCENCSTDYAKCRIFVAHWNKTKTSCIFDSKTFYCSLHSWKK